LLFKAKRSFSFTSEGRIWLFSIAIIATSNSPRIWRFCREWTANFPIFGREKFTVVAINTCRSYSVTFMSSNSYSQLFEYPFPFDPGWNLWIRWSRFTDFDNAICSTHEHDQWIHSTSRTKFNKRAQRSL